MKRTLVVCTLAVVACAHSADAPAPRVIQVAQPKADDEPAVPAQADTASCPPRPRPPTPIRPVANVPPAYDDPMLGRFDLTQAIAGLHGTWPLVAEIRTSLGTMSCELWDQVAPRTVANFVGLARGLRPFKLHGSWVRLPAYDGTTFHRVIEGFVIQGGDPTGTGAGDPGYVIPDEIDETIHADHRGLLYMANRGPNTNGMQFFILDAPAPHLDAHYTAFGECTPDSVIAAIAHAGPGVVIDHVDVSFENPCR
jgi:peptidyl-prolyl cis-trans isomerase A (cyclophilin A)